MTRYTVGVWQGQEYAHQTVDIFLNPKQLAGVLERRIPDPQTVFFAMSFVKPGIEGVEYGPAHRQDLIDAAEHRGADWVFLHDGDQWLCTPLTGVPPFWGGHEQSLTACHYYAPAPALAYALRTLLECPDIADSDNKAEETHAAERIARAALAAAGDP